MAYDRVRRKAAQPILLYPPRVCEASPLPPAPVNETPATVKSDVADGINFRIPSYARHVRILRGTVFRIIGLRRRPRRGRGVGSITRRKRPSAITPAYNVMYNNIFPTFIERAPRA